MAECQGVDGWLNQVTVCKGPQARLWDVNQHATVQCGIADIYSTWQSVHVGWKEVCASIGPLSLYPICSVTLSLSKFYSYATLFEATVKTRMFYHYFLTTEVRLIMIARFSSSKCLINAGLAGLTH